MTDPVPDGTDRGKEFGSERARERASDAMRQMLTAAEEAAAILLEEAEALRACHTMDGVWEASDSKTQAEYERWLDVAARLTAPRRDRSRKEGPDLTPGE